MKDLIGINLKPKTAAACYVNIRKAIYEIKDKPELKVICDFIFR
jgi:hypothetical protein